MSDFRTVDLDAVLDQFESEFDEEEKEKTLEEQSRCEEEEEEDFVRDKISVVRECGDFLVQDEGQTASTDGSLIKGSEVSQDEAAVSCSPVNLCHVTDEPITSNIDLTLASHIDQSKEGDKVLSPNHIDDVKAVLNWPRFEDLNKAVPLNETDNSYLCGGGTTFSQNLLYDFPHKDHGNINDVDDPTPISQIVLEAREELFRQDSLEYQSKSNDTLSDHMESCSLSESVPNISGLADSTEKMQEELVQDAFSPTSTSSNQSSHAYESIYDKYSNLTDQAEIQNDTEPTGKGLSFEPAEISDEKLDEFLTELENKEDEITNQRAMGARPKESRRDVNNEPENEEKKFDETISAPAESPPPYSEIDPVNPTAAPSTKRPTTLEIGGPEQQDAALEITVTESIDGDEDELPRVVNMGPPGSTPANPNGPGNSQVQELLQGLTEDQLILGKVLPFWVPDSEAPACMICDQKFTLVKRRHHCRACGKVLCSLCGSEKAPLPYLEVKEARVCKPCKGILERLQMVASLQATGAAGGQHPGDRPPNPSNPMEYCSTVPPHLQASSSASSVPPVMVPVSVLKRFDATPSSDPKQVMFSDGIRPGGALTELDDEVSTSSRRSHHHSRSSSKRRSHRLPAGGAEIIKSMIPPNQLPYVSGRGPVDEQELRATFSEHEGQIVPFVVNRNLRVYVSLIMYSPISKKVWNFRTLGMTAVGQDEILLLLVQTTDESLPPRDIFEHFQTIYEQAGSGTQIGDMGHSVILSGKPFLDGSQYGGFLYFRPTFQSVDNLDLPARPFLCAVLLTKWEMPWARVFPLRLLLRLGAEARYYPCPLWSTRQRQTVFKEIGNTIMKLLSDFRNFSYSLPIIRALVIHMEDKLTTIIIPKNSYSQIQRALQNSNDPVLALGANFSIQADSHLVAVQREENEPPRNPMNNSDYETQAINILNKPRKVTGASFLVLNGALKSASGLTAKSSIVEDGIMVQVSQERMLQIRKSLNQMEDCQIDCGPIGAEKPDETVYLKWVENDLSVNAGIKSVIDGSPMDGITSVKVRGAVSRDVVVGDYIIRWTELFMLPTSVKNSHTEFTDPPDPARVASQVADAVSFALGAHLKQLKSSDLTPLAVRVHLDAENAGYEAGSKCAPLPGELMNQLDNFLVPIVHGQTGSRASFELVFHVLDI